MPIQTMDSAATEKLLQYLNEAHATEHALSRTLEAHIEDTPRGSTAPGWRNISARQRITPAGSSAESVSSALRGA